MTETRKIKIQGKTAELVIVDGKEVGIIRKMTGSKSKQTPWQAFKGIGEDATLIGSFYKADGGRQAAIEAIAGK